MDLLAEDRNVEEMFLNFELHRDTVKFTGIDLGPLEFTTNKCAHRWVCWRRSLMGFRPSPYNSIRMFLIAEEVIRGDRHNLSNTFQWSYVHLNLPGMKEYNPSLACLSKWQVDGLLASNFVCLVDDPRVVGHGQARVIEAGHAISTREAWLGIQDALRKISAAGGTQRPGIGQAHQYV